MVTGSAPFCGESAATTQASYQFSAAALIFFDFSSTPRASFSLWATNFFAIAASASPSICAARIPALVAPGLPMATVATGMPAGICTVASKESMPCREVEGIGTPITGKVVRNRDHACQMRRSARARDDHANAALRSLASVVRRAIGRPMRGSYIHLIGNPELIKRLPSFAHDLQIGVAAHHDRNDWLGHKLRIWFASIFAGKITTRIVNPEHANGPAVSCAGKK